MPLVSKCVLWRRLRAVMDGNFPKQMSVTCFNRNYHLVGFGVDYVGCTPLTGARPSLDIIADELSLLACPPLLARASSVLSEQAMHPPSVCFTRCLYARSSRCICRHILHEFRAFDYIGVFVGSFRTNFGLSELPVHLARLLRFLSKRCIRR